MGGINQEIPKDRIIDLGLAGYLRNEADHLKSEWRHYFLQNTKVIEESNRIGSALAENSLAAVVLKGAAWMDEIYEDRGMRCMSDLDLLVDVDSLPAILSLLRSLGYEEFHSDHFEASEFAISCRRVDKTEEYYVDLHVGKIFSDERPQRFWEFEHFKKGLFRLKKEDALVHFAGHVAFQNAFQRIDLLLDIDAFIRKYQHDINWERVRELSKLLKKRRALNAAVWCAHHIFGTPVPRDFLNWKMSFLLPFMLPKKYLWNPRHFRFRYLLLKHLMKDSVLEAWKTDWKWIRHTIKSRSARR